MVTLLEVMDKEPTLARLWYTWAVAGVVFFVICRRFPVTSFILIPLSLLLSSVMFLELTDRNVGPDILAEAGWSYVIQAYVVISICVAGPIVGTILGAKRRRAS